MNAAHRTTQAAITLDVNGNARTLAGDATVASLVAALDCAGKRIAVELNGAIVPRSAYAATALRDGDRVEIVGAVGGG
jgi:sulfur carrier protein